MNEPAPDPLAPKHRTTAFADLVDPDTYWPDDRPGTVMPGRVSNAWPVAIGTAETGGQPNIDSSDRPETVWVTTVYATLSGQTSQTHELLRDRANRLEDVLDQLHSDQQAVPMALTPDGRPGLALLIGWTLDALEQEYHDRKCGCAGWPSECAAFNIQSGQAGAGARQSLPVAWSVADVLRVANAQAYQRAAGG